MKAHHAILFSFLTLSIVHLNCGLPLIWDLLDGGIAGTGQGYDVVTNEPRPMVLAASYQTNNTGYFNHVEYSIPDGMFLTPLHHVIWKNNTQIAFHYHEYFEREVTSWKVYATAKVGGQDLKLAFNGTRGEIEMLLAHGANNFAFRSGVYLSFGLQLEGMRHKLNPRFLADVMSLPKEFDPQVYRLFVTSWGTHYVRNCMFGCSFNFTLSFSENFVKTMGMQWTSYQADLALNLNETSFGIGVSGNMNQTMVDDTFIKSAAGNSNALGGKENLFKDEHNFEAWLDSCETTKAPILIYSYLQPLSDLIDDPVIRHNVESAIIAYGNGLL